MDFGEEIAEHVLEYHHVAGVVPVVIRSVVTEPVLVRMASRDLHVSFAKIQTNLVATAIKLVLVCMESATVA